MRPARYAVIPTHDRPEQFATCLRAIFDQVDYVVVVSHRADYAARYRGEAIAVVEYREELPNISAMWNLGLQEAEWGSYAEAHDVAVLNDDAVVPPGWFDAVLGGMRLGDAIAGCVDPYERGELQRLVSTEPADITRRLSGFAFILEGSAGLRADEQFRWWWGDTDLDWRARHQGGVVLVPGVPVEHPPGGSTPPVGVLADIAAEDRERFIVKWGDAPW